MQHAHWRSTSPSRWAMRLGTLEQLHMHYMQTFTRIKHLLGSLPLH